MAPSTDQEIRELRSAFWSERDPDGRAFASLADAYRRSGDFDQALELLEEGLDRHPGFASARLVAAWVHRDRGRPDEADAAFRGVLELDGENGEALRGLGELAAAQGRNGEAVGWLTRLSELEPGNEELTRRIQEIETRGPAPAEGDASLDVEAFPDDALSLDSLSLDALSAEGAEEAPPAGAVVGDDFDSLDLRPMDDPAREPADGGPAGAPSRDAAAGGAEPVEVGEPEPSEPWGADEHEARRARDHTEVPEEVEAPFLADALPDDGGDDADADATEGEGLYTRTMAELYVRQGLYDRALRVYEHLEERDPDDVEIRARVSDLRARVAAAPAEPTVPASAGARGAEDAEVEALARDLAEGSGDAGELSTPFAWDVEEREDEEDAEPAGPPVSRYLRTLLEWEASRDASRASSVVDVADLAPSTDAGDAVVDVADLAPSPDAGDAVVDVADLAPSPDTGDPVVDVADLAPSPDTGDPVVDVADLAPSHEAGDAVVDVADLAPPPAADDPLVDIADLAPGAPDDAEEASDEDRPDGGGEPDSFSRWLDQI